MQTETALEVCPNCGQWAELHYHSGWCANCTEQDQSVRFCADCQRPTRNRSVCDACRRERFYIRYADELEWYLVMGFTLKVASIFVVTDARPTCISCGAFIKGGQDGAKFCQKNVQCRKAQRRYRTLRNMFKGTGLDSYRAASVALQQVVREIAARNKKGIADGQQPNHHSTRAV